MVGKNEIAKLIVAVSAYYQQQLSDQVVMMYAEDLSDLPLEQIKKALNEIRRDPRVIRFPLPAVIRAKATPGADEDSAAKEAAAKIVAAVSKYGWNNPEKARTFVGALGWAIIDLQGGWGNVCENLTSSNIGQMQAQWRDLGLSLLKTGGFNRAEVTEALPGAEFVKTLTQQTIKLMDHTL